MNSRFPLCIIVIHTTLERPSITCSTYSAYSTLLDKTLVGEGTMLDGGFVWVAFMEL